MATSRLVTVKFFASIRDDLGLEEIEVRVSNPANRCALNESLKESLTSDQLEVLFAKDVAIAVNHTIQKQDFSLKENDEVAFMPPITGG